jgi:hypothetical protein
MKKLVFIIIAVILVSAGIIGYNIINNKNFNMENTNPILTESQVLDIAMPVIKEKCTAEELEMFKPWVAIYDGEELWTVRGTLPEGTVGGTQAVVISDKTGKVVDTYQLK